MTVDEIREEKRKLGVTNAMIAEGTDLPIGTVQKIFSGETRHPRYETLQRIEAYYHQMHATGMHATGMHATGMHASPLQTAAPDLDFTDFRIPVHPVKFTVRWQTISSIRRPAIFRFFILRHQLRALTSMQRSRLPSSSADRIRQSAGRSPANRYLCWRFCHGEVAKKRFMPECLITGMRGFRSAGSLIPHSVRSRLTIRIHQALLSGMTCGHQCRHQCLSVYFTGS